MRTSVLFAPALLVTLLGCGSTDESSPAEVPVDYETMRFETPEFDVPPGDSFECFYLDAFSEKEMAVIGSDGQQDKGGHHILLYWTDTPQDPQHHPCDDAEMLTWRQNCPPNRGKSRLPARCSMIHSNSCVAWRCDHV